MKIRWPVDRKKVHISVKFNQWYFLGRHKGLDLAPNDHKPGMPIMAVEDFIDSKVINSRYGYGKHVILTHKDGWTTIYAHMQKIHHNPGWKTGKAGALLGYMGNTGLSRGNHLHLEMRKNGRPVNPMNYFI
jgi:murein DD-endopeptidase MepM/ murein hydrolase activator NlpD